MRRSFAALQLTGRFRVAKRFAVLSSRRLGAEQVRSLAMFAAMRRASPRVSERWRDWHPSQGRLCCCLL